MCVSRVRKLDTYLHNYKFYEFVTFKIGCLWGYHKELVTNYGEGGLHNWPGGGGDSFSHAEGGGGTKCFGVVFTW